MAKTLKEKIRITYLAVAVKNPGYVWGKKLWSFNAWVHHGNTFSEYGGSTKFPVKKKHAFNLPKKSFSIDIDVTGRRSIKIAFEAKLHALGTTFEMGKVMHTLRAPYKQMFGRIDTVKNFSVWMNVELLVRGRGGVQNPNEFFASRDTRGGKIMTTVSGKRVARWVEVCPVKPVPNANRRWPVRPLLPAGTAAAFVNTSGVSSVQPDDDVNVITNPAVVPILTRSQASVSTCAIYHVTYARPMTLNLDKLRWKIHSISGGGRAEVFGSNKGDQVYVRGIASGEILIEVTLDGARVAAIRARVMRIKTIKCRFTIVNGPRGSGTLSGPSDIVKHLAIANRFLRQAGIWFVLDTGKTVKDRARATKIPGIFRVSVARGVTRNISLSGFPTATQLNYVENLMNFVYIHSCAPLPSGGRILGAATDFPASRAGTRISDSGTPSSSWIPPTGLPPDATAKRNTMKLLARRQRNNHPKLFAMYITNACGSPTSNAGMLTYGTTIAHEIGHVLSLRHRNLNIMRGGVETSGHDGLKHPPQENLMHANNPATQAQDLDLLQVKAIHRSPLTR